MKLKLFYTTLIAALIILGASVWWFWPTQLILKPSQLTQLPGWNQADLKDSLLTFQKSCRVFLKQNPEKNVGSEFVDLKVKDWLPACHAALAVNPINEHSAKLFFEQWFAPVAFYQGKRVKGLFTGYYMPTLKGSETPSAQYSVPLYELPNNLLTMDLGLFMPHIKHRKLVARVEKNKILPYYTRKQINAGAIKNTARVLAWINSPIDRVFLEIQGSGVIELENGRRLYIGYDGENGAPYTAIAGVLIKKGVMTKHNASMQGIKRYLEAHPKKMNNILNQNRSFVFFKKTPIQAALGSPGLALTPGYSMAIDKKYVPMGTPIWLDTTRPDSKSLDQNKPMRRLMVAQDVGGAIHGIVRGDVFWGEGEKATSIAGHMKNEGYYWLLLPRHVVQRIHS